ncbi:hypothetical protein C482_07846 [Natrialba chahannaoensis JCM 10990]|uniref:DUF1918 domain-containing protein n=1 Tax=Natrialba chahannaoensis JCM 10990 TaxID=1227492 RepID=M0AQW7_9EURY|nr:hypothetical protein [Natrialba chahannaoensis]ELZ01096.1 hypothetical protein C482_07846 [Natrialba chahannaoensis JCM 10990]
MSFEKDDKVVLTDKHSDFNGDVGTVTQTMESMFGDVTYTVSFEDGQETGIPEEDLEAADVDVDEDEDGDDEDEN